MKLLFMPWLFKPLYSPLVDKYFTRKWWLQTSMLALAFTCLLTSVAVDEKCCLWGLSALLFLLNLFSAVQDIAVDSLAVTILNDKELGAGNLVQVVAYKAGSMFAGTLLLLIHEAFGWTVMFATFSFMYFSTVFLTSFIVTDESKKIQEMYPKLL